MSSTKLMSFVAILISVVLYWTTANVCRYNFAIDKKTNILSLIFLIMGIILPYLCKEIKLLEFVFFTLLQSPLLFMTFNVIKKNTILNKKAINISRMVILFSGIYFCIL